ncbi:hypothetical protein [Robertmurraya sp. P23]|uniref:hypothetical protein n=1 Tax=Robertmurraya sp. P23 TaxID=3436931 RepID=UPI003D96BE9A
MENITISLDSKLSGMLNELKDHYDEETSKSVSYEELIKELIVAHYYMEVKKQ